MLFPIGNLLFFLQDRLCKKEENYPWIMVPLYVNAGRITENL